MSELQAIGLPLVSAFFFAAGHALQKDAVARHVRGATDTATPPRGAARRALAGLRAIGREPRWLGGMLSILLASALDLQAVSQADLTLVKPLLGLQAAFVVVIGVGLLGERIGRGELAAIAMLVLGAALVALTAGPGEPSVAPHWPSGGIFAACALVTAALAASRLRAGAPPGGEVAFGVGAGLLYGVSDFLMKRATSIVSLAEGDFSVVSLASWASLLRTPELLYIATANLGAFGLLQLAYGRGRVAVISPLASLSGTAFVVLLGFGLLGEPLTATRSAGIMLVLLATGLLLRSERVAQH